jgi:hypothetical protein
MKVEGDICFAAEEQMCVFFAFESRRGFKSLIISELGIDNNRYTTNSDLLLHFLRYCVWASEVRM